MSVNSSSSNDSFLHSNLSTTDSHFPYGLYCYLARPSSTIYTIFFIIRILLLLPLTILVLYMGLKQWRQQRSTSTAAMSHSDSFSYHMVPFNLTGVIGCFLCCLGINVEHYDLIFVGFCLWTFAWYGETLFQVLTCWEHYLAVVHPITYLSLKSERGIRIRNISIGCVWLLCFVGISVMFLENVSLYMLLSFMIFSFLIILFCSLSVLYALLRPGPGEHGSDRDRVDQSKRRAFYTIMTILGALFLRCLWNVVWIYLNVFDSGCVVLVSGVWCNLPGSVVLPLLFVLRAGGFACYKNTK